MSNIAAKMRQWLYEKDPENRPKVSRPDEGRDLYKAALNGENVKYGHYNQADRTITIYGNSEGIQQVYDFYEKEPDSEANTAYKSAADYKKDQDIFLREQYANTFLHEALHEFIEDETHVHAIEGCCGDTQDSTLREQKCKQMQAINKNILASRSHTSAFSAIANKDDSFVNLINGLKDTRRYAHWKSNIDYVLDFFDSTVKDDLPPVAVERLFLKVINHQPEKSIFDKSKCTAYDITCAEHSLEVQRNHINDFFRDDNTSVCFQELKHTGKYPNPNYLVDGQKDRDKEYLYNESTVLDNCRKKKKLFLSYIESEKSCQVQLPNGGEVKTLDGKLGSICVNVARKYALQLQKGDIQLQKDSLFAAKEFVKNSPRIEAYQISFMYKIPAMNKLIDQFTFDAVDGTQNLNKTTVINSIKRYFYIQNLVASKDEQPLRFDLMFDRCMKQNGGVAEKCAAEAREKMNGFNKSVLNNLCEKSLVAVAADKRDRTCSVYTKMFVEELDRQSKVDCDGKEVQMARKSCLYQTYKLSDVIDRRLTTDKGKKATDKLDAKVAAQLGLSVNQVDSVLAEGKQHANGGVDNRKLPSFQQVDDIIANIREYEAQQTAKPQDSEFVPRKGTRLDANERAGIEKFAVDLPQDRPVRYPASLDTEKDTTVVSKTPLDLNQPVNDEVAQLPAANPKTVEDQAKTHTVLSKIAARVYDEVIPDLNAGDTDYSSPQPGRYASADSRYDARDVIGSHSGSHSPVNNRDGAVAEFGSAPVPLPVANKILPVNQKQPMKSEPVAGSNVSPVKNESSAFVDSASATLPAADDRMSSEADFARSIATTETAETADSPKTFKESSSVDRGVADAAFSSGSADSYRTNYSTGSYVAGASASKTEQEAASRAPASLGPSVPNSNKSPEGSLHTGAKTKESAFVGLPKETAGKSDAADKLAASRFAATRGSNVPDRNTDEGFGAADAGQTAARSGHKQSGQSDYRSLGQKKAPQRFSDRQKHTNGPTALPRNYSQPAVHQNVLADLAKVSTALTGQDPESAAEAASRSIKESLSSVREDSQGDRSVFRTHTEVQRYFGSVRDSASRIRQLAGQSVSFTKDLIRLNIRIYDHDKKILYGVPRSAARLLIEIRKNKVTMVPLNRQGTQPRVIARN